MKKKGTKKPSLRHSAERILAESGGELSLSADDMANLIHELGVYRIELELQNEELRGAQQELLLVNEELRYARDCYSNLFDYAPNAYFTVDLSNNRILEANFTASELVGADKTQISKSRFNRFVEPEFADVFHICARAALEAPYKDTCEIRMRRADGSGFWSLLEIRGAPGSKQVRIAVTDITGRKQVEQIKDDFIGMVSHELRTPLTVLLGSIRVARLWRISLKTLSSYPVTSLTG